jgi:hypothetical protein
MITSLRLSSQRPIYENSVDYIETHLKVIVYQQSSAR